MKFSHVFEALAICWLLTGNPHAAEAAPTVIEAGQTHTLREDLVLDGDDVLEIRGTAEKPCTLIGDKHRIRSGAKWTGSLKITHCLIKQLGATASPGIDVKAAGKGGVLIENCTFDACSAIHFQNDDNSTANFRNNTVLDNTTVAINKDIGKSAHAFEARGNSKERKLFQGNFISRGKAVFQSPNWLIGGDTDADSNLFIGLRIGIDARGDGSVVRGNYFHLLMPLSEEFPYWSQISVFTTAPNVVGEHNVIRDGEWIVRFVEGEFRYNVISDIIDHDLMQNGSNGRIHHNLFLAGDPNHWSGSMSACIAVIYPPKNPGEGIEVFNNVFDGGDRLDVPGIEVAPKAFVKSVRNNVFFNFAHKEKYYKMPQAMIRPLWNDDTGSDKAPRLGYADYNLFYNPKVKAPRNYLLSVAGKEERKDAGFGLNDIPRGGKVDEQADPKFKGPIPKKFPFADDDIKARKVTVSKILASYRDAYAPAEGSPLIGAGDPADGPGSFIGAIGPGKDAPNDRFGRFGAARP
ncbi:hypothetical protein AYO44_13050 [Planctomycetaceae bacterium SCGC AG-212-F19]|nr:hypothetical protein AYO44_13050 [Planctomycetaceae bacterium SCGC AG-212-F19]